MEQIGKNTEITQSGQAIRINLSAFSGLNALFSSSLGPASTTKMLINSAGIKVLRDGRSILDSVMFTHPVTTIINKAAVQSHDLLGDGVCTFVVFASLVFQNAFAQIASGQNVLKVNERILKDLNLLTEIMGAQKVALAEEDLSKLLFYVLNTKMGRDAAHHFTQIVLNAYRPNLQMVEILKMDGDLADSAAIDGLVLDHAGRHPMMPREVLKACILICNISLEYEKPEINTSLHFKSAAERESFVAGERAILNRKIDRILELKSAVESAGKKLVLMTERGIDLPALDRLQGMLCLRRVKRRNLERLLRLCGGRLVSAADDVRMECLGYAGSILVKEYKDKAYTYVTKAPYTGCSTIVIHGTNSYEMERVQIALKSALKMVELVKSAPFYVKGGPMNYKRWSEQLSAVNKGRTAVSEALYQLYNTIRADDEDVMDCFVGLSRTLFNAGMVSSTLLMVDEIIRAGKSVKEEKNEQS
ncbi:Chaperonin complex component, TCP-1 zeta subunit (CCT6) [Trachipleistophora hominis]|uniref:Chaperonin complex component, TCP-1 zeta subunit (CCT6) n=1 Tax=Trachipleistophora hominis TaxID=72359 RepID=L7JVK4_TRAHO|nr:Chaperonin complex component, TCP-1 zeta subunit (CCT6) [Trachipleistophora hominis]